MKCHRVYGAEIVRRTQKQHWLDRGGLCVCVCGVDRAEIVRRTQRQH